MQKDLPGSQNSSDASKSVNGVLHEISQLEETRKFHQSLYSKEQQNLMGGALAGNVFGSIDIEQGQCNLIDFILIIKAAGGNYSKSEPDIQLLSHHACHCSALGQSPVWWFMEGPRTDTHDFLKSYYGANIPLVWDEKDQPRVHVVPAYTPYYAPQAEMASAVHVLCVDLSYAPDVDDYLVCEDTSFPPNNKDTAPIHEGMSGAEVEKRLNGKMINSLFVTARGLTQAYSRDQKQIPSSIRLSDDEGATICGTPGVLVVQISNLTVDQWQQPPHYLSLCCKKLDDCANPGWSSGLL